MDFNVQFSIFVMMIMFIISGFNKTISLGTSEASRFANKTGLTSDISQMIVIVAGLYELLASGMILYGTFAKDANIASIGGYMLILFTLLATLIFYVFPFKYKPFLSNLSVASGLFLMLNICFFKSEKLS